MKKTVALLAIATSLIGSGCVGANATKGLSAFSANMAKDHALVIAKTDLITPWGQEKGHFVRVGDLTNTVVISPDGAVTVNPTPAAK